MIDMPCVFDELESMAESLLPEEPVQQAFEKFQKIPRLSRNMVVTEKIDGTNGQIYIPENGRELLVGSRKRWITPDNDNFGFARWAVEHQEELLQLGPGRHFGEWWGQGIQRKYGLDHKRFSLFNVGRWWFSERPPECCHVVPVLYDGPFHIRTVDFILEALEKTGSVAAPGFMDPEGVVIYHQHARQLFKKTIGNDGHKEEGLK